MSSHANTSLHEKKLQTRKFQAISYSSVVTHGDAGVGVENADRGVAFLGEHVLWTESVILCKH